MVRTDRTEWQAYQLQGASKSLSLLKLPPQLLDLL